MTLQSVDKIRAALAGRPGGGAVAWRRQREMIGGLTDEELAEAEAMERLGRRRYEALKMISAERRRRAEGEET